jgi:hypothetical protein
MSDSGQREKVKRFFVRAQACNDLPGKTQRFEVVERENDNGEQKQGVCYDGFLRQGIADSVAEMLNERPAMTWVEIQEAFAAGRKICL